MKTPVEIKKGLLICGGGFGDCAECPYHQTPAACMKLSQDALAYIQQLERRICELTENVAQLGEVQPKWISVDERLPENSLRALVRVIHSYNHTDGYAEIAMSYFVNGRWEDIPPKYYDVTHWMPLPELPEVKNANE